MKMKTAITFLISVLVVSCLAHGRTTETDFSSLSGSEDEAAFSTKVRQRDSRWSESEQRARAKIFLKQVLNEDIGDAVIHKAEAGQSQTAN